MAEERKETFGSQADMKKEFMFSDEIKEGMRGIGKTVFNGTKIEEFEVEIKGVLRNVYPRKNVIFAVLKGGPLAETGLIGGMSGSPVYIDGRLIGAVAYGWAFSKEPLAGITPIEDMLALFEEGEESPQSHFHGGEKNAWHAGGQTLEPQGPGNSFTPAGAFLQALPIPMAVSGFEPEMLRQLSPFFSSHGLMPVLAGSTLASTKGSGPLEPGAAVGLQLVKGDLNVSAIGTLTFMKDQRVLAFGHPFLSQGKVEVPLARAYIHTVASNQQVSTKVGSITGEAVGSIQEDRFGGVAGLLGPGPEMIPLTIQLIQGDSSKNFSFEVVRNPFLSPLFMNMALVTVVIAQTKTRGDFSAHTDYTINLEGLPPISNRAFFSGTDAFVMLQSDPFTQALLTLLNNPFEEVKIKGVSMKMKIEERLRTATLVAIRPERQTLRPGQTLKVSIYYQPFQGSIEEKEVMLTIPEEVDAGSLQLFISDMPTARRMEAERASLKYMPTTLPQLRDLLDEEGSMDELYIFLQDTKKGASLPGLEMPSLPSSVLSVLSSLPGGERMALTQRSLLLKKIIPMGYQITGSKSASLTIDPHAPL